MSQLDNSFPAQKERKRKLPLWFKGVHTTKRLQGSPLATDPYLWFELTMDLAGSTASSRGELKKASPEQILLPINFGFKKEAQLDLLFSLC